jgi:hypothetical protein
MPAIKKPANKVIDAVNDVKRHFVIGPKPCKAVGKNKSRSAKFDT